MTTTRATVAVLAIFAMAAATAVAAAGQPAYLVKELPVQAEPQVAVEPGDFLTVGNRVFFFGNLGNMDVSSPDVGLWVSDGTAAGTQPLAKLCVNDCTNYYVGTSGSLVYLAAGTDNNDHVLWRSDGTRAGTFELTPSGPPVRASDSSAFGPPNHAFVDGRLLFIGCKINGSCNQLWRTDGTVAGTTLVADLTVDVGPIIDPEPGPLVALGDNLYFLLPRPSDGDTVIWRSDGTTAGTGPLPWAAANGPRNLTAATGHLFFLALNDQQTTLELWATDGNHDPGPITPFTNANAFDPTGWLKPVGSKVYFLADDGLHGVQLWVSDGTAAGTAAVTGLTGVAPLGTSPDLVQPLGRRLIFFAGDPPGLWATSGAPGSTVPLCPPGGCGPLDQSAQMFQAGKRLVVLTGTFDQGYALWGTDGTAAGTMLLKELCGANACLSGTNVQAISGTVFFQLNDGVLWQTDGTAAGTKPYAGGIVRHPISDSSPFAFAGVGSRLLFNAPVPYDSFVNPDQLWATDGTAAGTHALTAGADVDNQPPSGLLAFGDRLFFQVGNSLWQTTGTAATTMPVPGAPSNVLPLLATAAGVFFSDRTNLWRTDGTAAGTRQVTSSFMPGQIGGQAAVYQGKLYFAVLPPNSSGPIALWQSDGTASGTVKAIDLPPFPFDTQVAQISSAGNHLFYVAIDEDTFQETLWSTDLTAAGTFAIAPVPFQRDPELTAVGSEVFFIGTQEESDELWRTDGTVAGTGPVLAGTDPLNAHGGHFSGLTELGGNLYLLAGDPPALWRSDGTAGGTVLLHQFANPAVGGPSNLPMAMTTLGSRLVFPIDDGVHGNEPWVTDGTAAGTALLRDINPGPAGSLPAGLTAAAGRLYFAADDGAHGSELWETDGTAAGTRLVQDVWPGPEGSNASGMVQAGGLLYFTADDGITGTQLWALPLTGGAACVPGASTLCLLGNRFKVEALWEDPQGDTGTGQAVALTPDTGYFWFFDPSSVEVITKIIDGRALNDSFWFFYGALSNVQYWLTVTDTVTGIERRYLNPQGQLASVGDTTAFGPQGAAAIRDPVDAAGPAAPTAASGRRAAGPAARLAAQAAPAAAPSAGSCRPGPQRLCLAGSRFAVSVSWQDFSGHSGKGMAVDLTSDTGSFWFFDAADVELVLKVLDGRAINGKFWVFFGALSDVAYTVTVEDTTTGSVRTYTNPAGQFASVADTTAF